MIGSIYVVSIGSRTKPMYLDFKNHKIGRRGKILRADAKLGYVPIPDSRGAEPFPIGRYVPVRYDQDGFRVPLEDESRASPDPHPMMLALGCSFTYGVGVSAENTYPHLAGQYLGGTVRNAAMPGYGLSQMVILAKRLVPVHKPDYLLVQYSPWLVDRAQSPFAPGNFGRLPTPYFIARRDGLRIHPPVFMTKKFDLPTEKYWNSEISFLDQMSFLRDIGLPLYIHDDFHMSLYRLKNVLGLVTRPASNREQIIKTAYGEIGKVARAHGTKFLIVILGTDSAPVLIPENVFPLDAVIVRAHDALIARLPVAGQEAYAKSYYTWGGSPPRVVDAHPNEKAHRIIAESIIRRLNDAAEPRPKNGSPAASR